MLSDPGGIPALDIDEAEVYWALREHVEQLRHPLPGLKRRHMKDEDKVVDSFDRAMASLIARLPPEQRLAGLAPEQVLSAYAPEQRLAGLDRDHQALALTVELLRVLPDEYVRSLSPETQAEIRRRLQRNGH